MRTISYILAFAFYISANAQELYFPPNETDVWETTDPSDLNWCPDKIEAFNNFLDSKNTKAFILLKDGKIVIESYFDDFTQDSVWYWASAGKTLTGFAVGVAQQENFFSIEDKTSDYLGTGWTNCTLEQEDAITIRHQLTMTTGLDDGVQDNNCTTNDCLINKADAGTRWAYHNGPYTLLDEVLTNASGQSLTLFVNTRIMFPIGAVGAYFPIRLVTRDAC